MIARRKYSTSDQSSANAATIAQAHLAHIAALREARAHHRAITHELRTYYDSVAAEAVPDGFLRLLVEETNSEST